MATIDKTAKTNASRLLDKAGIAYTLIPYKVDENDLSAMHICQATGIDSDVIYKTIVLHGDKTGNFVCIVPGMEEIDLKKAAKISGNKYAELIPVKNLPVITGYIRGGCSPIGMKKSLPTYIHNTCTLHNIIYVSAGQRGLLMGIATQALITYTQSITANIVLSDI